MHIAAVPWHCVWAPENRTAWQGPADLPSLVSGHWEIGQHRRWENTLHKSLKKSGGFLVEIDQLLPVLSVLWLWSDEKSLPAFGQYYSADCRQSVVVNGFGPQMDRISPWKHGVFANSCSLLKLSFPRSLAFHLLTCLCRRCRTGARFPSSSFMGLLAAVQVLCWWSLQMSAAADDNCLKWTQSHWFAQKELV